MNECSPREEADAEAEACGRGLECVNREGAHDCRCPLTAAHYARLLERVDALLTADAIYCTGVRLSLSSPLLPRALLSTLLGAHLFIFISAPLALFSIARLLFSTHNNNVIRKFYLYLFRLCP